jgi:hypothetical protein
MRIRPLQLGVIVLVAIAAAAPNLSGHDDDDRHGNQRIALIDDCDPDDPNWAPIGCNQKDGDVTAAEFGAFLRSPLYDNNLTDPVPAVGQFLVGHPSWRNDPSHIVIEEGKRITVRNVGGRPHSFTEVPQFGGGVVAGLNVGTQPAACAGFVQLDPGDRARLIASGVGIHRFQCCFHPWMRATVRVIEKNEHDHH